jgi:hypothetical protein
MERICRGRFNVEYPANVQIVGCTISSQSVFQVVYIHLLYGILRGVMMALSIELSSLSVERVAAERQTPELEPQGR